MELKGPNPNRIPQDLRGEAAEMAELLFELSKAVRIWRSPDLRTAMDEVDESFQEDAGKAVTLVTGKSLRQIGRYKLRRHVGSGAMGDVYEAHDPQLDRSVAIKVPRCDRDVRNRSLFTERFIREARAAAAVRHAHICPIYDAGQTDGQPWVVMAFVDGQSLDAVLANGRIDDTRQAVQIAIHIAEALSAIHQHGIIHRDLKPGNILIDRDQQALLTDFGLALSEMNIGRITCDGVIVGTPVYMSPEQAAGENSKLTPASDIYSLGAVLYEMLTGQAPFRAPLPELLRKIMLHPVPPVASLVPEIDPVLAAIVEKSLAKAPEDRFVTATAFVEALRSWIGSVSSDIAIPAPALSSSVVPVTTQKASPATRRTLLLVAATLVALTLLIRMSPSLVSNTNTAAAGTGTTTEQDPQFTAASRTKGSLKEVPEKPQVLTGKLKISISSDPEKGPVTKSRLSATERGALPLVSGELLQFEVELNQPAYIYLLWVNPDGTTSPLFPWDAEHHKGWDAPILVEGKTAADRLICPDNTTRGFEAGDPVGLQTVVLLARRTPLEEGIRLGELLKALPSTPALQTEFASGPILRGVVTGQTKSTEDPQYDALKSRLSAHFELISVVSFPQVSASANSASEASARTISHREIAKLAILFPETSNAILLESLPRRFQQ